MISLGVATFVFLLFEFLRLRYSSLNRWFFLHFAPLLRATEKSHLTGASYILIASWLVFLAFEREIAVLALSFLAVGDAIATLVGQQIGKTRFLGKTLEGNLACFFSCFITGLVYYYAGLDVSLLTILIGASGATVIEAVPLPISDNLTMPLFAGILMTVSPL